MEWVAIKFARCVLGGGEYAVQFYQFNNKLWEVLVYCKLRSGVVGDI